MLFVISSVNQLFFVSNDPTLSLLATFATYIVALIMRPIGGAIFGNFGDKHGRKKAMIITIMGFSTITFLTGLLPTWQTIGILSPILLIILRFAQGLFAGGEWASGSVITMETAPKKMRGLLSGFVKWIFLWICNRITCIWIYACRLSWTGICRDRMEDNVLYRNSTRISGLIYQA